MWPKVFSRDKGKLAEDIAEYTQTRMLIARALRSGRTSFPTIARYVRSVNPHLSVGEIHAALVVMEKLGEVELEGNLKIRGLVDRTKVWPNIAINRRANRRPGPDEGL